MCGQDATLGRDRRQVPDTTAGANPRHTGILQNLIPVPPDIPVRHTRLKTRSTRRKISLISGLKSPRSPRISTSGWSRLGMILRYTCARAASMKCRRSCVNTLAPISLIVRLKPCFPLPRLVWRRQLSSAPLIPETPTALKPLSTRSTARGRSRSLGHNRRKIAGIVDAGRGEDGDRL